MIILNYLRWRRIIEGYRREHGLAKEPGATVESRKPFGKPYRRLLTRVQKHLHARGVIKEKDIDGTLNGPTQHALDPPLTMGETAVAYALSQVGVHESPWGSNAGKDVMRYQTSTGAYRTFWCASFFWYCWQRAGYKGATSAGAWDSTDHHGTRIGGVALAKPGDGVSFNVGDGHIGMYLSHTKTHVKTVDGNTSDQVAPRERPISSIHSISRPHN